MNAYNDDGDDRQYFEKYVLMTGGAPIGKGAMGEVSPIEDLPDVLVKYNDRSKFKTPFHVMMVCVFMTEPERIVGEVHVNVQDLVSKYPNAVIKQTLPAPRGHDGSEEDHTETEIRGCAEMIRSVTSRGFVEALQRYSPFLMKHVDPQLLPPSLAAKHPIAALVGLRVYDARGARIGSIALMKRMVDGAPSRIRRATSAGGRLRQRRS